MLFSAVVSRVKIWLFPFMLNLIEGFFKVDFYDDEFLLGVKIYAICASLY